MRISSGFAKGLELKAPRGLATRPTTAKVRSAVIDSVQSILGGASVLDLFAGTGGIGIEALSRGATRAVFVEQARDSLRCLNENVEELKRRATKQGVEVSAEVHASDVELYFGLTKGKAEFDLVFADPPYADAQVWLIYLLTHLQPLLNQDGLLLFEATKEVEAGASSFMAKFPHWRLQRSKGYGDTSLLTFCYNEDIIRSRS